MINKKEPRKYITIDQNHEIDYTSIRQRRKQLQSDQPKTSSTQLAQAFMSRLQRSGVGCSVRAFGVRLIHARERESYR
jgi:hypothetical protein